MNPITLANEVEERYHRYLKTTFYFKDPDLRKSFEEALSSGRLSKGPYLEATPIFARGQTPRALFQDLLGVEPDKEFLRAMQGDRPLYRHQEEAIRRVFKGYNVVIATGTGSGKTEAFLYPILLHLYQEFYADKLGPGVRALVLYPMNALANDQRERLGEIRKRLEEENASFRFTFGQYIGETPENENDFERNARAHLNNRLQGELVLRSEMRREPPHILLTNYSMLEYLLLRPDDSPLFDNGSAQWWSFLVLDEAHQYRGSRGIEMAMLLRRLKQRLREGGRTDPFYCIATSATLGGEEKDKEEIAKFSSNLFGENFRKEDVIQVEGTGANPDLSPYALDPEDYRYLWGILCDGMEVNKTEVSRIASKLGVSIPDNEEVSRKIGRILQSDVRVSELRHSITNNPTKVQQLANQIFSDLPKEEERVSALSDLVEVPLKSRDPNSGASLLSARYHLFLRSLEGAFIAHLPQKKIFLDRKSETLQGAVFEVALCRECGQHYLVGRIQNNKLVEAIRDPGHPNFEALFFRPIEDTEEAEGDDDKDNKRIFKLCLRCGEIRQTNSTLECGHSETVLVEHQEGAIEREGQIPKCTACGYRAPDPVREVVHGTDGPHAVIATTLYQNLPQERKKVLAFADGRQEAAFFAWYLEDSYQDILSRNLVFKVAQRLSPYTTEGLSLQELAIGLRDIFREKEVFPPATGPLELLREAWLWLYHEFLTDELRISLGSVGLVQWAIKWPDWFELPELLLNPPWSLTEKEAQKLVFLLLDSMRTDRAVEIRTEPGISVNWSDLEIQALQMRVGIGPPKKRRNVRSWDGKTGRRARFLAKLLMRINNSLSEQEALNRAVETLRAIWETLKECDKEAPSSSDRLLLPVEDARRLNPDWWRLHLVEENATLYQCDICGRLQTLSVRGVCPRHRCPGTLKAIQMHELEPNHYRFLYREDLPGSLRVEEHTAQLDKEKAREFQRDFRGGNISILSCSTTFELGVDLGDLDTIFLRNVPPEAFNYAQRVGRAGRRSGYPGFAITFCRRGSHDLYHFAEPERMLSGQIRPPVFTLHNERIILRHIVAVALSHFFRAFLDRFTNVEKLFKDLSNPSGVTDFKNFLQAQQTNLEESLYQIVPIDMLEKVGLNDGSWIEKIAGNGSRFALAEAEASSDYQAVKNLEVTAVQKADYDTAGWAKDRAQTLTREDVPSFLSRKVVIPKYGFPVDVVELDTQRTQQNQEARNVLLQRDLSIAIAEFAPTSKLVVNKNEWTSYGLKKVAGKEWPRKFYKRCPWHNVFYEWEKGQPEPSMPCGDHVPVYEYIMPQFGFITSRERPKKPTSRPARVFTTRPYFGGSLGQNPGIINIPPDEPLLTITKASPGRMVVLCEGRRGEGFYICSQCGAGFRRRENSHKTPYGQECNGTLNLVSLGQEFVTDVLQLQFHRKPEEDMEPVWFAYSLAYALVEGAGKVLEVPTTDLSATVAYSIDPVPPIILYDNVPGGAALVAQLEEGKILRACLESALERVSGKCECGENTSCYGCLRNYRNQFAHQHLQRGPIMRYLDKVLSEWK